MEKAKLLWDEYKYRHDLIWKNLYKITAALVALSVVPYTGKVVTEAFGGYGENFLRWFLLVPPSLAVVVALYSFVVMDNEIHLFQQIKEEYREFRRSTLNLKSVHEQGSSNFQVFVRIYLVVWGVLVALNLVFVTWAMIMLNR